MVYLHRIWVVIGFRLLLTLLGACLHLRLTKLRATGDPMAWQDPNLCCTAELL